MHSCDVCGKVFKTSSYLVMHKRVHTDERPFVCDVCGKAFRQKSHMNEHRLLHSSEKRYKCVICEQGFKQSSGLRAHISQHHKKEYDSKMPKRGRPSKQAAKRNLSQSMTVVTKNHQESSKNHQDLSENRQESSENHQESTENHKNNHLCRICELTFPTKLKLDNHVIWHSRRHRYKCKVCDRMFKHLTLFQNHQKTHSNVSAVKSKVLGDTVPTQKVWGRPKKPVCKKCGKTYSCWYSLTRHLREHHGGARRVIRGVVKNNLMSQQQKDKTVSCIEKPKIDNALALQNQELDYNSLPSEQHGVNDDAQQSNATYVSLTQPLKVKGCASHQLPKHDTDYASSVTDTLSPGEQKSGSTLSSQQLEVSEPSSQLETKEVDASDNLTTSKTHTCHICQKKFCNKWAVTMHVGRIHGEKKYKCHFCDKSYGVLHDLQNHYRSHPAGTMQINYCDQCNKTFSCAKLLKKHRLTHKPKVMPTGIRPYKCYVCGFRFTQTCHLKTHCFYQHKLTKPYKCNVCGLTFEKKLLCNRHVKTCIVGKKTKCVTKTKQTDDQEHVVGKNLSQHINKLRKKRRVAKSSNALVAIKEDTPVVENKRGRPPSKNPKYLKNSRLACEICGAKFKHRNNLLVHRGIHFNRRPHACRFCNMQFRQAGHLYTHVKNIHDSMYPYQCGVCEKQFERKRQFIDHQRQEGHIVQQPNPNTELEKSGAVVQNHKVDFEPAKYTKIVSSAHVTKYACNICEAPSRMFKSLSSLRRHITVVHTQTVKPLAFDAGSNSKITCAGFAKNESGVTPTPSYIYKCDICSVIVHGYDALEAHEKAHAKNKHITTPSMPPTPSIQQTVECKFCGKEFDSMSREAFDQHQLDHELAAVEPIGMAYICLECNQEFAIASDLIKHHSDDH